MHSDIHINRLKEALDLAQTRKGYCAPNPAVGAVVVRDQKIIAQGTHWAAGEPHAEAVALKQLGNLCDGAILYVTLEPCCHWGKTPPCTQGIIKSGIRKVYYAFKDPNPKVGGKGIIELEKAGIECEQIAVSEIDDFYKSYTHWILNKRPWVTAKLAITLDGKIAGSNKKKVAITGAKLKEYTHQQRNVHDAILTTINTIIQDDPQLNVRLHNEIFKKPIYVLDSQLRLPLTATILKTAKELTIFHAADVNSHRRLSLISANVRCVPIEKTVLGLNLKEVFKFIGQDGMHDVWVEAGAQCFQSLLSQQLTNRLFIYIAPKVLGANALPAFTEKVELFNYAKTVHWKPFGRDVVCEVYF